MGGCIINSTGSSLRRPTSLEPPYYNQPVTIPTAIMISPTPTPPIQPVPAYNRVLPQETAIAFNSSPSNPALNPYQHEVRQHQSPAIPSFTKPQSVITVEQFTTGQQASVPSQPMVQQNVFQTSTFPVLNQPGYIPIKNNVVERAFQNPRHFTTTNNETLQNLTNSYRPGSPNKYDEGTLGIDRSLLNISRDSMQTNQSPPELYTFAYGLKMPIMGESYQRARAF